jgi:hypothetical protein
MALPSKFRACSIPFLLALGLALIPGAVLASSLPSSPSTAQTSIVAPPMPLFGSAMSWQGFVKFWTGFANRADRIILIVSLVMVTALVIITRGKWM